MSDARAIVLAGAEGDDLTSLAGSRAAGGYEQLRRARGMEPGQVLEELLASAEATVE